MRRSNKGFTIVELVIVIAVIAILAAVLIPTVSGIVRQANISNDTVLVKNLNTALAASGKKHENIEEALAAAEAYGYIVGNINAKAEGNKILWDSKNDVFCYFNADAEDGKPVYIPETKVTINNVAPVDYWTISADISDKYSTYLHGYEGPTEITISTGLHVGTADITEITFYDEDEKDVVIFTNSYETNLIINAPKSEVEHQGKVNNVDVRAVKNSSYNEYGQVFGNLQVQSGNVNINAGAEVFSIELAEKGAEVNATAAPTVTVKDNAKVNTVVVNTTEASAKVTIAAKAEVENAGVGEGASEVDASAVIENNNTDLSVSNDVVKVPVLEEVSITKATAIAEVAEIDTENKTIIVKNVKFTASANKVIEVAGYAGYTIVFDHCIFDYVNVTISGSTKANVTVKDCTFTKYAGYCFTFADDECGDVLITDCTVSTQRGFLIRTPKYGNDVVVEGCYFDLSLNSGNDKGRAIQIATYAYYYMKKTDADSTAYYKSIGGFGSSYSTLSGKISITDNTFAKASYAVYIYEAQSGGGFTYGNVAADVKLFGDLTGNKFGTDCVFKYGCSDIGDSRSYTNLGYNTGLISSDKGQDAKTLAKRNAISGYKAEDYWDQMRALKELEAGLK